MVRRTQHENALAGGQPWFEQALLVALEAPRVTVETTDATASLRPSLTHPVPSQTSKLAFQPGFERLIRIMSRLNLRPACSLLIAESTGRRYRYYEGSVRDL